MKLSEAIALIDNQQLNQSHITAWADLGCGSGLFTQALSTFLADESSIHAIDKDSINLLPDHHNKVIIKKKQLDFIKEQLPLAPLDGILMVNSFHYVKDKIAFIKKAEQHLKADGCFIFIEYDTESANPWFLILMVLLL